MTGPKGYVKAIAADGYYFLFIDCDVDLTEMAITMYTQLSSTIQVLTSDIKIDLGCFAYITSDLKSVYPKDKFTWTDILHMISYTISYYKRRCAFLGVSCLVSPHALQALQSSCTDEVHENDTRTNHLFRIYHHTFRKSIDIRMCPQRMKRFSSVATPYIFPQIEIVREDNTQTIC